MKKLRQKLSVQKIANALFLMLGFSLVLASPIQALSDFYDSSEIQFFESCGADTGGGSSTGTVGGLPSINGETTGPPDAVEKVVWAVLTAGGIDDIHAAAIMGSIANEGGFNPLNTGYVPNNFDSKDPSNPTAVRDGYGLIGWTPGTNLLDDMKTLGLKSEKPYTAETQSKVIVGYLQKENKTGRYQDSDISRFLGAKTLSAASKAWIGGPGWGFERPADNGPHAQAVRLASAKKILKKYKGTTGSPGGGLVWPFATKNSSQYRRVDAGWAASRQLGG